LHWHNDRREERLPEILSFFCGPGGMDLGFEQAGFSVALAMDRSKDAITTYNANRSRPSGKVADLSKITVPAIDKLNGRTAKPIGVVAGPPCQSFSKANHFRTDDDPRHLLTLKLARTVARLSARSPIDFIAIENVPALANQRYRAHLDPALEELAQAGFDLHEKVLNASDYGVPQSRDRLFIVGLNSHTLRDRVWAWPRRRSGSGPTVRNAIGRLPEPVHFKRGLDPETFPFHPNHWCMTPKSNKFRKAGALTPGRSGQRSFKTLDWDKPSLTVAYGHREVHIHPNCRRRLSVFEAMRLQGFPDTYELKGTLSSQITQVSEAVPPPLASALARAIASVLRRNNVDFGMAA
jgi:DNA (cytosine-5)-methyltransferase 1